MKDRVLGIILSICYVQLGAECRRTRCYFYYASNIYVSVPKSIAAGVVAFEPVTEADLTQSQRGVSDASVDSAGCNCHANSHKALLDE